MDNYGNVMDVRNKKRFKVVTNILIANITQKHI